MININSAIVTLLTHMPDIYWFCSNWMVITFAGIFDFLLHRWSSILSCYLSLPEQEVMFGEFNYEMGKQNCYISLQPSNL